MKQSALEQSVARATGETVECIRRRGFTLVVPRSRRPRKFTRPATQQGSSPENGGAARTA